MHLKLIVIINRFSMKPNCQKRKDGRSDLQHSALSVISFRNNESSEPVEFLSSSSSCIIERQDEQSNSSMKIFCEVDGPKPQTTAPLVISISTRENDVPAWWHNVQIEKAIQSALIPALLTPPTGWSGTCFELSFVIELPEACSNNLKSNLRDELSFLQLVSNCVNAGSVALIARGVPMRDFVIGCVCSVSWNNDSPRFIVDPVAEEMTDASVVVAASILPSLGQMTSLRWYTSHCKNLQQHAGSWIAECQQKTMECLVATAISLRPVLTKAVSPK